MRNRMTLSGVASVVVLTIAASAGVQTGHAQTATAQATTQAKADECRASPGATAPKGSHWYYRIDRQTKRRCWYIGAQKARSAAATERTEAAAERPAPARRRAAAAPAPAPSALRADEDMRDETRATGTTGRNTAPAEANAPIGFPAWPNAAVGGPYVPVVPAAPAAEAAPDNDTADAAVTEAAAAEEMPPVWPVMSAAERTAAAEPAGSSPSILHLVIFLAAIIAFVGIAMRAVLKLTARQARPERREPPVRPAEPIIRRRSPPSIPAEPSIEAMSEPSIARLREVAKRWEAPARVQRQPRLPAFEVEPEYEVRTDEPRRRRAMA